MSKIKKLLAVFVNVAVMLGVVVSGVFTTSSSAYTDTVNRTIPAGGTWTHDVNIYIRAGELFNINMTCSGSIYVGLINVNTGVYVPLGSSSSSSFNITPTINYTGTYNVRIINGSTTASVSVNGSFAHGRNARIMYDSTCDKKASQLRSAYDSSANAMKSWLNARFWLDGGVTQSSTLNGSSCSLPKTAICFHYNSYYCDPNDSCNTLHHKGAQRLNGLLTSSTVYTFRIVGHRICWGDDPNHRAINGLAHTKGRDSISTEFSDWFDRTIQHELSHNLGASHCSNNDCVMNGNLNPRVMNTWCPSCRLDILKYIAGM
jgi:hypothetical protein